MSDAILYIGKADYCTVQERMQGRHKGTLFSRIAHEQHLSTLHATVGLLHIPIGQRFSSELLSDVESLLIMGVQPHYNRQARRSRISRPGLFITCVGQWTHQVTGFKDV
ncbi:MAG: hypothetical protein ACYDBW_10255 [Sulfuricaulis sp.]